MTIKDTDEYKTLIKRQIQDWLSVVGVKKHQEWLVVHIANQESSSAKSKTTSFLSSMTAGSSVPDRIKSDVASLQPSKKDRYVNHSKLIHKNSTTDW